MTPAKQLFRVAVALGCILLVLLAGSAQLLHQHAVGEAQSPHCSLCAVAHLTSAASPVAQSEVLLEALCVAPPDASAAPSSCAVFFQQWVRPPPALAA